MKTRLPRVRRWEYVDCVLSTARGRGDLEDLTNCLVGVKTEFEKQKSMAMGRGKLQKKGLAKAGDLVSDTVLLAADLGLIEGGPDLVLTRAGEELVDLKAPSSDYLCRVLPRLVTEYEPVTELLDALHNAVGESIQVPETRNIKSFRESAETQGLHIGQTDYMMARDLLGQLGVVNWSLFGKRNERYSRAYMTSDLFEAKPTTQGGEPEINLAIKEKVFWLRRRGISLANFLQALWGEYIDLVEGVPLRPVFYSHLRDAVCQRQRIGDPVFDTNMSRLLDEQEVSGYLVFGSGGTVPYSSHSSSVLKSLPLKFEDGRYIVYIKMEKRE